MAVAKSIKSAAEDSIISCKSTKLQVIGMFSQRNRRSAISLVEVLIAMAILSTLALPMGMFLVEYNRGSSQLGDYYQILNLTEEKLEKILAMPFHDIPLGKNEGRLFEIDSRPVLDLRPAQVGKNLIKFNISAELVNLDFTALKDAASFEVEKLKLDSAMKRIEVIASWGKDSQHKINLLAYKANL